MGDKTGIEWTDATWNPLLGCRRVSPGCENCYAERQAIRMAGATGRYHGIVSAPRRHLGVWVDSVSGKPCGGNRGPRWTGASRLVTEVLDQPLRWKRPRRIFVDSMADLFFEGHSNEDIAAVFGVMAAAPQHTFQVLTKRPARAREWFMWAGRIDLDRLRWYAIQALGGFSGDPQRRHHDITRGTTWPLPNVWLGVSAENQATADERIPLLLETPAAVRFVSYEPALGPVDFSDYLDPCCECETGDVIPSEHDEVCPAGAGRLSWVIAGSESGPGARPAELEWFRSVRSQCEAAGVAFLLKQWVGFRGCTMDEFNAMGPAKHGKVSLPIVDGRRSVEFPR